jgi:hypothetical protein
MHGDSINFSSKFMQAVWFDVVLPISGRREAA